MELFKRIKKSGIFTGLSVFFASALALALVFSNVSFKSPFLKTRADNSNYQIVLDSTNKVSSAGDKVQKTKLGNDVTFTYTGVNSSTTGHVTLNANGTIVNKDHIRSIQSITATFTGGTLKFKTAYGGDVWNAETVMETGYTYDLGTNPYFVSLKAYTSSVTLTSLVITYSCVENPDAYEGQEVGDGLLGVIDFWDSANAGDTGTSTAVNAAYVQERTFDSDNTSTRKSLDFVSSVSASYAYQKRYGGIGLSSGNNAASLAITLKNGYAPSSVKVIAGSQSPSKTLTLNSVGKSVTANCTNITELTDTYTNELTWEFDSAPSTLTFTAVKSSKLAIYRIYLYGETGPSFVAPEETIIGFTASDSKSSSYYQDEIYDSDNGLVVKAQKTGGTEVTLSMGGVDGYSYVIKNSNGETINTAVAFGTEGIYTLIVSYKNYIPAEIQLTVGFRVVLTGIEVVSANTIFNTAQKLSDYTSGITANLTYNRESENETGVAYSNFASKGISLTLLNPSDVAYSITSLFGTAGTWKIKVTSNSNSSVFGMLNITVNAIPVTAISVTGESATVEEESQLQLTASVTPNNATVQTVTWESNHTSIATVNTNGLVTGVSAGEARITATATDGSAVYGYIDITVTAKPQQTEFDADMAAGSNSMACTVDDQDGVKVGTSKASGSMTITVGEGATKLSFYAAGWSGTGTTLSLSGATLGNNSIEILGDSGISGSGSAYSLSGTEADYYCETTLTNVLSETTITITASKRFALWNAKYYTVAVEPVYPTSISLEAGSTSVAIGGTTSLEVSYLPADTNVKNVAFCSNATSVATVSSEGIITGVAAGSARITATAEAANNGTVTAYVDITVTTIAVTGVSVSPASADLTVGGTQQLTATIAPSNATNKNVTWVSDTTSVATVSSAGLVTAVAAGTATITVTSSADNTKKATCTITVTASGGSGSGGEQSASYEFTSKSWAATPANWTSGQDGAGYLNDGVQVTSAASGANGTSPTSYSAVQSVVVTYCTNASKGAGNINVYVGSTQIGSKSVSTSGGTSGRDMAFDSDGSKSGTIKIEVECTTNSIYIISCTINYGTSTPTNPTSISISPSSIELAPGGSKNLAVNYTPSSANQNKDVTWTRYSGSSNITVTSEGVVSVASNATAGNTAVIRATLTNLSSIYAQCTVTVVEQTQDDQTILLYICGSDLESNGQTSSSSAAGYASGDITEILKVGSQPDDVNVVMETGGAKCWKTTHGINKSYLERYHVANKSLVRDSQETKANMGLTSTLQNFLTWGVQTYPADRISLILWNHGGAMRGVCYDENYSSDCLTNSEVKTAVANTFTSLGRSTSDKFEWIGYDACLMQVQDIAEFNSQYFNYMVASEESEAGAGWDYDNWLDDAYAKKTTPNILKAICDSFLAEQGSSSDQTLSYLDLSYMSAYKSAWETMSSTINSMISSYGKSNFQTLMKSCQDYGSDSDCEGYSYFGIIDAKDVVNKIRNTSAFSGASTQTSAVLTAFSNLVAYSKAGSKAGNSYGLCCFFPMKDGSGYTCNTSSVYTSSQTNFTNWRSIVTSYGD